MRELRQSLLRELGITLVLDVGANAGQYATSLRADGYRGRIISFEPLPDAYAQLAARAAGDPLWSTQMVGLADVSGPAVINVSANSYSSSLLPISTRCTDAAPDAAYVHTEDVDLVTLDELGLADERVCLKIDVQGYEPQVLRGATDTLPRVAAIELELSLAPLYEGQELAPEVCATLRRAGFVPVGLDVAFADPTTGELLQLDGLFRRLPNGEGDVA